MGRLFALADLHLSGSGKKPMDRFGDLWRNHGDRMAENWDETVGEEDTTLLAGDLSWARSLSEAEPDLAWIAARPGRKILLRGNHDGWWSSLARVRSALPPGCHALQNDAVEAEGCAIVGARGWTAADDPIATAADARVFVRELERLRMSIADADRSLRGGLPRVALLHYPPWLLGRKPTAVVDRMQEAGVKLCVYGHLHGEDHRMALRGEHRGIRFVFVAADAVAFRPVPVAEGGVLLDGAGDE